MTTEDKLTGAKPSKTIDSVAIRFAGDSGDGMQLTGTKFTDETALARLDGHSSARRVLCSDTPASPLLLQMCVIDTPRADEEKNF